MRGFTLVELLIVIAILGIVGGLSVPFIQSFQVSSDLATHSNTIARTLRRAQMQAITGLDSQSWGVYFDSAGKKLILFQGDDFATRDQSLDQQLDYSESFSVSTDFSDEIYFVIYSGSPSVSGVVIVASLNDSKNISIDSFGLIQVN